MLIENLFHNICTLGLSLMKQFTPGILPINVSQDRDISNPNLAFKNILLGILIAKIDFGRVGIYNLPTEKRIRGKETTLFDA